MSVSKPRISYWKLDYGWAKRGGKWSDLTDVMLIGTATGEDCISALDTWVSLQDKDQGHVDGHDREIFYAGGVQGYLESSLTEESDKRVLFLHSHGQDAFDSLSYYSKQIAEFLRSKGCAGNLTWQEGRHDRKDHQLIWP